MPPKALDFEMDIRKFRIDKMDRTRSCIFIGGSGTGKSHLVTDVLYHNRDMRAGIVMSGTEEGDPYWAKFIPDLFIYNQWQPDKLEDLIDIQKKKKRALEAYDVNIEYCQKHGRLEEARKLEERKRAEERAIRKFVIIDDCMYNSSISRTDVLRKVFMNGRHWNMFVLLTIQYCVDLHISLRGNAGYVFVCREPIINYRKRIFDNFLGMLPSFAAFEKVMDTCTQNYECLVLDKTAKTTKPEEALFWYKAAASHSFRIGSERLWAYHRENYDKNHEDRLARERKVKREQGIINKKN